MSELALMFPFVLMLVYLGLIVYGIVLAARLVTAVEQIARSVAARPPELPHA
jgi:hypothetical protein